MRVLLDINVVLDVMLRRSPFIQDSARLLNAIDLGKAEGFVATHTVTTAFYVAAKNQGPEAATASITELLRVVDVVAVTRADLLRAAAMGWRDYEDAVQSLCAQKAGADLIATRDLDDFRGSPVPALSPAEVLARLPR